MATNQIASSVVMGILSVSQIMEGLSARNIDRIYRGLMVAAPRHPFTFSLQIAFQLNHFAKSAQNPCLCPAGWQPRILCPPACTRTLTRPFPNPNPDPICRLAAAGFVAAENVTEEQCQGDGVQFRWNTRLLPYICPLVARKFGDETVYAVMHVLTQVCCHGGWSTCIILWSMCPHGLHTGNKYPPCCSSCCAWLPNPRAKPTTTDIQPYSSITWPINSVQAFFLIASCPCSWTVVSLPCARDNISHCNFRRMTVSASSCQRPCLHGPAPGGATAP